MNHVALTEVVPVDQMKPNSYCGIWMDDPPSEAELFLMRPEEKVEFYAAKARKESKLVETPASV